MNLLLVEDDPNDARLAAKTAIEAGITRVDAKATAEMATRYLEKGLRGEVQLPDVIVLDLNLGYVSGHEVLRLWYSTPALKSIPMIVWSSLDTDHKLICECFGIKQFVSKFDGEEALRNVLSEFTKM